MFQRIENNDLLGLFQQVKKENIGEDKRIK